MVEGFVFVAAVELAAYKRDFFILEVAEDVHHEFLAVVLEDRVELLFHELPQVLRVYRATLGSEHGLKEQVEGVAEVEVVPPRLGVLVDCVLLLYEVVLQLSDGDQALQTRVHVAVQAIVPQPCHPLFQCVLGLHVLILGFGSRRRHFSAIEGGHLVEAAGPASEGISQASLRIGVFLLLVAECRCAFPLNEGLFLVIGLVLDYGDVGLVEVGKEVPHILADLIKVLNALQTAPVVFQDQLLLQDPVVNVPWRTGLSLDKVDPRVNPQPAYHVHTLF